MPIYGRGANIRDWLFVKDHARALSMILRTGLPGECYNVGGGNEVRNIDVATLICDLLDQVAAPLHGSRPRRDLITFVPIDPGMICATPSTLARSAASSDGARRKRSKSALRQTVEWYL